MLDKDNFERLTNPRSVAVVGGSDTVGSYGWRVARIVREYGSSRNVYVVNPRRTGGEVQGLPSYASLRDLPEPPDCSIVVVPPAAVPAVLDDMAAVGSSAGLVLSAPHGAGVAAAQEFDAAVLDRSRAHGLCLLGPNTMGLISAANGFAATFGSGMLTEVGQADPAPAGGVAMVSQSGAAISYLLEKFRGAGVGYSHLFSTGNETVVDFVDLLERLVDDPATHTIVLYIESVAQGDRLRRSIEAARAAGKAVVVMRIGSTAAGQAAAQSHSGRIAGDTAPYRALAEDTGSVYVEGYEHLYDTVRTLNAFPASEPRVTWSARRNATVITTSGGAAVVALDELGRSGWSAPHFSEQLRTALDTLLGEEGHDNPLDLLGLWKDEWRMSETLRVLAASGELDAVVLALGGGGPRAAEVCRLAAAVAADPTTTIPIVFADLGLRRDAVEVVEQAGAAIYSDLSRAVRSLEDRMAVAGVGAASAAAPTAHEEVEQQGGALPAGAVLKRLADSGVAIVPSRAVELSDDAAAVVAAAESLGYPVALKIEHPGLLHKSDVGGVQVDVRDAAEVERVVARFRGIVAGAGLADAGVGVQRMLHGVEVLVGARADESFGHVLLVGVGGTLTELIGDVRLTLLPTTRDRVAAAIASHSRLTALLQGQRGALPADVAALVDQVWAIARWIYSEGPGLVEFDANPVIASPEGAFVVDARAVYLPEASR